MSTDVDADAELRHLYGEQAGSWNAWVDSLGAAYSSPLAVGLTWARNAGASMDSAIEFSSGTGAGAAVSGVGRTLVVCDATRAMIAQVDPVRFPRRVVATNAALPFAAGAFDFGFALNGVPHPGEFLRVLRPESWLLWAYSHDADTPVFVPFDELAAALDADYTAQRIGPGSWALFAIGSRE